MSKGGSNGMTTTLIHENLFRFIKNHRASTTRQVLGFNIIQTEKLIMSSI